MLGLDGRVGRVGDGGGGDRSAAKAASGLSRGGAGAEFVQRVGLRRGEERNGW